MEKLRPLISFHDILLVNLDALAALIDRGSIRGLPLLTSRRRAPLQNRDSVFLLMAVHGLVARGVDAYSIFGVEGLGPMGDCNICLLVFLGNTGVQLVAHLWSLEHPMFSSGALLGSRRGDVITQRLI